MAKQNIILQGIPASVGRAQGRVRIVKNQQDLKKLKQGDIVVSSFLDPAYFACFQKNSKVVGIITNEGDRTCHAAIIARESQIPYIAGVQLATKKLKNNMRINMDGNKGIVYEIS